MPNFIQKCKFQFQFIESQYFIYLLDLTHNLQLNKDQKQKITTWMSSQKAVYEQYIKTLEAQINTREKERQELTKSIYTVTTQNRTLVDSFHNQKITINKFSFENQEKENKIKSLTIQCTQLRQATQKQSQMIRSLTEKYKASEETQQKLRFSYEQLQKQYKQKSFQLLQKVNFLRIQTSNLRQKNQELQMLCRQKDNIHQKQIIQITIQKKKIIERLIHEKQIIQIQIHHKNEQIQQIKQERSLHMQTTSQNRERQLREKDLQILQNSRLIQDKNSEIDKLSKQLSTKQQLLEFQINLNQSEKEKFQKMYKQLREEFEVEKQNFALQKKQFQQLIEKYRKVTLQFQTFQATHFQYQNQNSQKSAVIQKQLQASKRAVQQKKIEVQMMKNKNSITIGEVVRQKSQLIKQNKKLFKQLQEKGKDIVETQRITQLLRVKQKQCEELKQTNRKFQISHQILEQNYIGQIQNMKKKLQLEQAEHLTRFQQIQNIQSTYKRQLSQQKSNYQLDYLQVKEEFKQLKTKVIQLFQRITKICSMCNLDNQNQVSTRRNPIKIRTTLEYQSTYSIVQWFLDSLQLINNFINQQNTQHSQFQSKLLLIQQLTMYKKTRESKVFQYQNQLELLKQQIFKLENQAKHERESVINQQNQIHRIEGENQNYKGLIKQKVDKFNRHILKYEQQINLMNAKIQKNTLELNKSQSKCEELQDLLKQQQMTHQIKESKIKNQKTDLIIKYEAQIKIIHQTYKINDNQNLQSQLSQISSLEHQLKYFKQKNQNLSKKIQKKDHQIQQLKNYYQNQIQRIKQQQPTIKVQKSENNFTKFIFQQTRIKIYQQELLNKTKQIQILEENNRMLRKQVIQSLNSQEKVRTQLRQARSNYDRSTSKSKDKSVQRLRQLSTNSHKSANIFSSITKRMQMNISSKQVLPISIKNRKNSSIKKQINFQILMKVHENKTKNDYKMQNELNIKEQQKFSKVPLNIHRIRQNWRSNNEKEQTSKIKQTKSFQFQGISPIKKCKQSQCECLYENKNE